MRKHGLIEVSYPDWSGNPVVRIVEVQIDPNEVYDCVFLFGITEPRWRLRGTYEKDTSFTGRFSETWVDHRMFSESEERKPAKGFQVRTSGWGIFEDEEHLRNFLKDYMRAKILYEIWDIEG